MGWQLNGPFSKRGHLRYDPGGVFLRNTRALRVIYGYCPGPSPAAGRKPTIIGRFIYYITLARRRDLII